MRRNQTADLTEYRPWHTFFITNLTYLFTLIIYRIETRFWKKNRKVSIDFYLITICYFLFLFLLRIPIIFNTDRKFYKLKEKILSFNFGLINVFKVNLIERYFSPITLIVYCNNIFRSFIIKWTLKY